MDAAAFVAYCGKGALGPLGDHVSLSEGADDVSRGGAWFRDGYGVCGEAEDGEDGEEESELNR